VTSGEKAAGSGATKAIGPHTELDGPRTALDLALHLREVTRLTGIGTFDHDHVRDELYWSPELRRIYGIDASEPATMERAYAIGHEADVPTLAAAVRRAHDPRGDGRFEVVHRIRRVDGEVRWLVTRAQTFFEGERAVRTIGAISDITSRRLVTASDPAQDARLWEIVDRSLHEVYLFDAITLRFEHVNARAVHNLGYSLGHLRTLTPLALAPSFDEAAFRALLAPLLAGALDKQVFESRHRRRDGTTYPVEIQLQVMEHDGARVFLAVVNDISDRRVLDQSMRLKDRALDNASHPIVVIRIDGTIEYGNAALVKLWRYGSADEIVGHRWTEFVQDEPLAVAAPALRATGRWEGEATGIRKDRTELAVRVAVSLIRDEAGLATHVVVSMVDLTEQRAAEAERARLQDQLAQAQRLETVGQLAGGIAHDFNNVLAVMTLTHSLLRGYPSPTPDHGALLDDLEQATARGTDLTRQLLLFSRRSVLARRPLELDGAIRSLLKMLQRLVGEDISLRYLRGAVPAWVDADPGMFDQLLTNLCVNARDAMAHGGQVLITLDRAEVDDRKVPPDVASGPYFCLTVADQGHGMDAATRARIFDPFFTTKPVGKGTGLGLSTVLGIVQQHGGWIEVDSAPGQGTTFRIWWPARAATADQADSMPIPILSGTGEVVLLVEDDALVLHAVAAVLQARGFEVVVARDGADALRQWALLGDRIRLLLTDLIMPGGMSGVDLAERIRATRPELPIVIFSGYGPERVIEVGRAIGGVTYLPKPCAPDLLIQVISERLGGH
jgi:two-component system, cell cycle sensor histidine kinase and response regulator CckA